MMKIPKELENKLRKFLAKLKPTLDEFEEAIKEHEGPIPLEIKDMADAIQLREDILKMINYVPTGTRYKQIDIEQEIIRIKSPHENY